jgi:hypothetical protein
MRYDGKEPIISVHIRKDMRVVDTGVELTGYCASVGLCIACCAYWAKHPFLAMYTYSGFDALLHDR